MPEDYQNMCEKCRNRKTCKAPCYPVEAFLRQDGYVHEVPTKEGIVVYPKWKEIQESVVHERCENQDGVDEDYNFDEFTFSAEDELPWIHTDYKLTRTNVFILRVFKGWAWSDIATALDADSEQIRCLYKKSVKQLLKALEVMDQRQAVIDDVKSRLAISEKATGKLPKTQRWFLLNKVFGLLPREIAEMDDANVKTVCGRIKDVYDRVITGDVIFTDPTPEQIEAARQRIEKKRQRDRKRSYKSKAAA